MPHITILVPEGQNNLSSIVGAYKILSRANTYWKAKTLQAGYHIELAGTLKRVNFHDGIFSVQPHRDIFTISTTNLIIIPSLNHQIVTAVQKNRKLIEWLKEQHAKGAEIASICTGAFLLAETGLLNNKSCSTHWAFAEQLQLQYPAIQVKADKIITDENGIYTNGGAYSFLNLLLYLVEKYFDRGTAIFCSKIFQISIDRSNQSEFFLFSGQQEHADATIREAQQFMEKNYSKMISIEQLAAELAVGRRNFDRRFIKATGHTPLEYVQRLRIEAAKKAFESSEKNITEVMYDVGYADLKAFRELFKK